MHMTVCGCHVHHPAADCMTYIPLAEPLRVKSWGAELLHRLADFQDAMRATEAVG
jgi:hypothetical protein